MKDKLVRIPFDQVAFEKTVHDRWEGYQAELMICEDKKSQLFIQVNYFQSCLNNAMEFLLKSRHGRHAVPPKSAIKILFDLGVLSEQTSKVAAKLNKIRNSLAHDYHNPNAKAEAEKTIQEIVFDLDVPPVKIQLDENSHLDKYEKLNLLVLYFSGRIETMVGIH